MSMASIKARIQRLAAAFPAMPRTLHYCKNGTKERAFRSADEAVTYEAENPGWCYGFRIQFPNGHSITWEG